MTANNSNEGANTGPENKNGDESKEIKEFVDKNTPKSKKESTLYYFYTTGCGFCKKAEPIVDELNKEGKYEILKLDLAEKDNQGLNKELKEKYKGQCGTPWFIDAETGNQVCGFREKDVIEKWASGEELRMRFFQDQDQNQIHLDHQLQIQMMNNLMSGLKSMINGKMKILIYQIYNQVVFL